MGLFILNPDAVLYVTEIFKPLNKSLSILLDNNLKALRIKLREKSTLVFSKIYKFVTFRRLCEFLNPA